ncbi:putative replicative DNA helicase [Candidatus Aquiluna sp. IMCC13023]|jgi:replicative DNA helicase|uniref:replicative DNA helicase n=1 Tax=Candidatus Aquiluna sp. IMCC13023 TaxID=1081644 RepID=UPI00025B188B|nr:replicative DNA helicase [Candidatus Aquiluna sp. IMCC13023]EIC91758.1 putative replicative DNA helicase [Candidatus Aquiluna sp. IMCC13023]
MSMLSTVTASDPRVAPHNLEAEQSTLGGMLLSQEAVAEVVEEIAGVDFYAGKHELIYNAILNLFGRGEPTDVIAVTDELNKQGNLLKAGGSDYLHSLASYVPTAANAGYYAKIVGDKAILRRLIDAGTRIAQSGYDSQGEVEDLVNQAQAEVYKVSSQSSKEDYVGLSDSLEAAIHDIELAQNRGGEMTGTPTGFTDLDAYTHGLHAGQLIIVAARPAVGKSTFALDIARNASVRHNQATIFFSLEMGRSEIAMRMLSAESSIYLQSMRKGTISEGDWTRLAAVRGRINDAPLYIDDSPNMSLVEIRAKCRRLAQQVDLKLVVIDYIQLMSSGKKVESRQQEVSEFSRALKLLAKELGLPVVALSQLNRQAEQSKDKRPELSHLRESGSLEQDADVVVLLHREGIYERDHPRAGEADLILAKQRNGPTGTVTVAFHGQYSRFVNMPS